MNIEGDGIIGKLVDLTGCTFGKSKVLYQVDRYTKKGNKVTYWHCKCECGTECDVSGASLRSGKRTSCGCDGMKRFKGENLTDKEYGDIKIVSLNKERADHTYWNCLCKKCGTYFVSRADSIKKGRVLCCPDCRKRMNDLTGQKFGKLTVLEKDGKRWKCECECGQICIRTAYVLTTGLSTSCGCDRPIKIANGKNLIGKKFGRLTVIKDDTERSDSRRRYLICECDCGNNVSVRKDSLESGSIVSCGCYHHEISSVRNNENKYKCNDVIFDNDKVLIKSSNDDTYFIIDDDDYDRVKKYCWHCKNGYAYAPSRGDYSIEQISMARLIMGCIEDKEIEVDHINHNRFDNRKKNLRLATSANNNWNKKESHGNIRYNSARDEWEVTIHYHLQKIVLGNYKNKDEALEIRDKAEQVFYGEFQYIESGES